MKKLFLIILMIIAFIPLIDLFHPGLPLTHDGRDHVARIANFYHNLEQGVIIPRWAGNLNWGYGHPILEFLYPLPSYLASFFHFFHFSFIDSAKIVYAIGMIFAGIGMYLWLSEFLSMPAAFIGGILYMFTPYRFVEIYVRGDIGENLAFVFMPFTLLFIYRLYKKSKDKKIVLKNILKEIVLIGISFACLMLSHNAIVLMYFPFIIFYILYLAYLSERKKFLLYVSFGALLLGFTLSAFFWIPALLEGKYTLRNIVTAGEYADRYVSLQQLLYGPWSYGGTGAFSVQLGIVNWVVLLLSLFSLFVFWRRKDTKLFLIAGLLVYTIISIWIMLPSSNILWQKIMLLQNFQFPWRFLAIPLFTTSVLVAIFISSIPKSFYKISVFVFLLLILFFNKDYWHPKAYLYKSDSFFTNIYDGTTDTGESSPVWSTRFMEHRYKQPMEVISGKASFSPFSRTMTKHIYSISVSSVSANVRENTVYFPGWEVLMDNQIIPIQYQDAHNRGIITFSVPQGLHRVVVIYKETKLRLLSDYVSLVALFVSVILLFMYGIHHRRLRYNKRNT